MCGSLEKRGDGDRETERQTERETERETETDLDSKVLSDSFGAVGPKSDNVFKFHYRCNKKGGEKLIR